MKLTKTILRKLILNEVRQSIRGFLDLEHAKDNQWEKLFQKIRDSRIYGAQMPAINYDELANAMNLYNKYDVARSAFLPTTYQTFEDWFLRNLSDQTKEICKQTSLLSDVCSPVQGTIRKSVPTGEITLKKSVVEVDHLLDILQGEKLVQISLQKTDYHHVHSPVNGKVVEVLMLEKDELFPGSESMTIIEVDSIFGALKVMCIGEWTVQTFIPEVIPGQVVSKLDKLGYFYFGSQVILVLPKRLEFAVNLSGKERVFPGDPLCHFSYSNTK